MSGSSPCSSCTKRCCSNYTVSIIGYDAWVIGRNLKLDLQGFLVFFPVSPENDKGFQLEPGGSRYEIALDKVGEFQKGNPCIFWVDFMNGRGRCGIYAHRPFVCQTYPAYQTEDTVLLRSDVLCPEGSWSLAAMQISAFRRRLHRFRVEQDLYAYLVFRWNRAVERDGQARSIGEFYGHLVKVYDRIERVRGAMSPEEADAAFARWGERSLMAPNPLFADLAPLDDRDGWSRMLLAFREAAAVEGEVPAEACPVAV